MFHTIMCKQNDSTLQLMLPLVTWCTINMPATQDIDGSGRLLPSIVRLNSESDIDEVINEEVTRLPVLVNNNIGEGELKEKWWMRQSNRFNIRSIKAKQKKAWHKKVSFHQQLPPLQGVCSNRMFTALQVLY